MRMRRWIPLVCFLGLLAAALATATARERRAAVGDLAWLAGHWSSSRAMGQEEWWTAPAGGMMLGLHRDTPPGREPSFEFMRIAETPEGLVFYASPGGAAPTPFTEIELGPRHVVFGNMLHDFPQYIRYEGSASGDTLTASISGRVQEMDRTITWTWTRAERARR